MPELERSVRKEAWYHENWFLALSLILFFPAGLILLWTTRRINLLIRLLITLLHLIFVIFPLFFLSLLLIFLGKMQLLQLYPLPILLKSFSIPLIAILITILAFRYDLKVWLKGTLTVVSILLMLAGWGYFFINTLAWQSAWGNFYYERGKESSRIELYDKAIPHLERAIQLYPLKSGAYFTLGNVYQRKKEYDTAIKLLTKYIELAPDNPYGYLNLGYCYSEKGLSAQAIELYNKTMEVDGGRGLASQGAHNNLGLIYDDNEKTYDEAIKHYKKAIELNPDDGVPHNNLGVLYYRKKMYDQAIEEHKKALSLPGYSTPENAHYNLGRIYDDNEETYDEAIKHYKRAIELKPDYGKAHNNLGILYRKRKMYGQAIEEHKKAISIPGYSTPENAHYNLASIYDDNKKTYDEAIKHYKRAIELNPDDGDPHNNLGIIYYKKKMYGQAIKEYKKALSVLICSAPENVHYNLALIYGENEKTYDEAIKHYKRATELKPDYGKAHNDLGNIYCKKKMYSQAIEEHRKALSIPGYGTPAEAQYNLSRDYWYQGEYDKAVEEVKKVLEIDPNYANAYCLMYSVYYQKGMLDEAVKWLRKALEIDPKNEYALVHLGFFYEKRGRRREAIAEYQKVLNLGEETEWAKKAKARIERLKGEDSSSSLQ